MEIISLIPDFARILIEIMGAAALIVKLLAEAWKITPGTPDVAVFTRTQKIILRIQKALGPVAGDTAKRERKNDP